ncbi:MAG: hypothetical protein IPM95_05875 [Sphingobacteriales bacterium]|nr:hypothetical protein [Sphingobacteriales bacterium]
MFSKIAEYPLDFYRLFYPRICGGCELPLVKRGTASLSALPSGIAVYEV